MRWLGAMGCFGDVLLIGFAGFVGELYPLGICLLVCEVVCVDCRVRGGI